MLRYYLIMYYYSQCSNCKPFLVGGGLKQQKDKGYSYIDYILDSQLS